MRHVTAQQLSAFLDGALSGVSRELVTRHLAACADCRERHALWHIYDEVLQRVLSWEPDEHTMEEASARVELALTAERRGLAPPEFTSVLHPVMGPTSGSASPSAAGLYPTLPPIAPQRAAAPQRPIASTPPAAPTPPAPPAHINTLPSANAYPLDPPASAPPPPSPPAYEMAPPPPYATPAAPPAPAAPWYTPPPPVGYAPPPPAGYAPPPVGYAPQPPSHYVPGYAPPPQSAYAPAPHAAYVPQPAPGYSSPISVHEDLRAHRAPSAPWASMPVRPKKRRWGPALLIGAALLAVLLLASPWLPDVIRIRLPEGQEPRVELVHHDAPPAAASAQDPQLRLAERTSSEPPPAPYRALPADSAAGSQAAVAHAESTAQAPPVAVAPPPPAPAAKARVVAHTPAPVRPRVPKDETESQDEGGTAAGVEHSMTFIPVQVKTEVRLSSSQPAAPPAPATDTVGDQALPLLCGEVVDESGAPIQDARIQIMVPSLTIRTDKRGRFCVALPAGEHTFLVDAAGFSAVTRGVELTGGTFETHITLTAAR